MRQQPAETFQVERAASVKVLSWEYLWCVRERARQAGCQSRAGWRESSGRRRGRGSGGRRWRRALQATAGCEDYVTSYSAPGPVPGTAVAIWHTVALITHVTQVWVLPGPPRTACCSAAAAPSWCLFSFWSGSQSSGRQKNNNDDECFER